MEIEREFPLKNFQKFFWAYVDVAVVRSASWVKKECICGEFVQK